MIKQNNRKTIDPYTTDSIQKMTKWYPKSKKSQRILRCVECSTPLEDFLWKMDPEVFVLIVGWLKIVECVLHNPQNILSLLNLLKYVLVTPFLTPPINVQLENMMLHPLKDRSEIRSQQHNHLLVHDWRPGFSKFSNKGTTVV